MDIVFHGDLMRLKTGDGPADIATIRHAALNIMKQIQDKTSVKVRKKPSHGMTDLLNVINQSNELQAIVLCHEHRACKEAKIVF